MYSGDGGGRAIRYCRWLLATIYLCLFIGTAYGDIRETKHNLSDRGRNGAKTSEGGSVAERQLQEREVCVFCHTPSLEDLQAAGHARLAAQPLWQRSADLSLSFGIFDDIGRTGSGGGNPIGSVSMACLSCHDSTQALGIGEEHRQDHPFGVPYRGPSVVESIAKQVRQTMEREGALAPFRLGSMVREDSDFRPVQTAVINERQIWWASASGGARRSKSDLPLYPRKVEEYRIPFVECTSCHDPHSTREVFLRTTPDQSNLCQTCHVK